MAPTIGDNIRRYRHQSTMTQEALAERAGLSVDTIRKLESNARTSARIPTLSALARALDVPTSALVGDASTAAARAEPDHRPVALMEIRRALTPARGPGGLLVTSADTSPPPGIADVRTLLHDADRAYRAADFAAALGALPRLIHAARAAVATDAHRSEAYALLAQAYQLAAYLLIQLRAVDLAYCAVTLGLDAADHCDDELVGATLARPMCWLLLRQGRLDDAERLATRTADRIEPRFRRRAAAATLMTWGRLLLDGAAAAARDNRPDDAGEMIDAAAAAAAQIGDQVVDDSRLVGGFVGFNAARVEMLRAETQAIAGRPDQVLTLAERIPPTTKPTLARNRHLLDVAWAHAQLGRYADATAVLTDIRGRAPDWLHHQRYARDIVSAIAAGRRRAMSAELAELASLVGATG